MAYDFVRDEVILFGGCAEEYEIGHFYISDQTWRWDGQNWEQLFPENHPSAREKHSMVYDKHRDKIVLFGGYGTQRDELLDTWEWDGENWEFIDDGNGPSWGTAHLYYIDHLQVVESTGAEFVYRFDENGWTYIDLDPPYPSNEGRISKGYDSVNENFVYLNASLDETWLFDGYSWTQATTSYDMLPIYYNDLVCDIANQEMMLYTSVDEDNQLRYSGNTYIWDGTDWAARLAPDRPWPQNGHCMADAMDGRGVLLLEHLTNRPNDTWELVNHQWFKHPVVDGPNTNEVDYRMATDHSRGVTVCYGEGETWEWDGHTWERQYPDHSPPYRLWPAMGYHADCQQLIMFGGNYGADDFYNDTWQWTGDDWIELHPQNPPREMCAWDTAYDRKRQRVIIYPGFVAGFASAVGVWEWDGTDWHEYQPDTLPADSTAFTNLFYDLNLEKTVIFRPGVSGYWNCDTWTWDGQVFEELDLDYQPNTDSKQASAYDMNTRECVVNVEGDTFVGYYVPPTITPTPTVTSTPSVTPTVTPSPTPSPTPTPPDGIRVTLDMPDGPIYPGHTFYLDIGIDNANPDPLTDIPLFVILEVADSFWYHPAWSMEPAWETLSIIPTGSMGITILEAFEWPGNAGTGTARFWGAVTDPEMTRVLGNYDVKNFYWE